MSKTTESYEDSIQTTLAYEDSPLNQGVVILLSLLVRAEFELTHSERTGDIDLNLLPDLRARIAAPFDGLDFVPSRQYSVADMANIGYALMQEIAAYRPNYCWSNSPAEIVGDLVEALAEEQDDAKLFRALLNENNPVDTIYLDNGYIIDVGGKFQGNLRAALRPSPEAIDGEKL